MSKVRVYNPLNARQLAINTEHIVDWRTDHLLNAATYERTEGFALHLQMVDGRKITLHHDQGGQELLELLEIEFYPLNENPAPEEAEKAATK